MQWLYPAGAWALLSLAVITALYLLKRQSVQKTAPSLLLWQKAAADQTASRPFQKLKKNILYFLQLLLALLLTAALMRPAVSGGVTGETVLIFDLSASMQAQANGESRLDEAKKKALSLVDGLHDGERVTVLAAGAQVRQCVTRSGETHPVRAAIEVLTAQNASADLAGAVSLLVSTLAGFPVSTTHTKTTAMMGVGAARKLSSVHWGVVGEMALAWLLTFPGCALIGYLMAKLLLMF